jgi:Ca2+-transporting ATPase
MRSTDPGMNRSLDTPEAPPFAMDVESVVRGIGTSVERGLTTDEAHRRLTRYGANRLRETRARPPWRILLAQFRSSVVALLAAASGAAFAFGQNVEAFSILVVIAINAAIGFSTEWRATRSMAALHRLGQTWTRVRRDGAVRSRPASDLVPGDIVVLDAGDAVPADCRLIEAAGLQVDESTLTGESLPVEKQVAPVPPDTTLPERTSMVFRGTAVTRGSGLAVVTATGLRTELGQIAAMVGTADDEVTPLERRLARLSRRLIVITLVVTAVVAAVLVSSGRAPALAIEIAIALAVATVPEGLPIVATVALARGMWRMASRHALVRELAAVETLGSTTLILTDKTGTLTENRMTVTTIRLDDREIHVDGDGLSPSGRFVVDGRTIAARDHPTLLELLRVGVFCNNADLGRIPDGVEASGDPTEVALLVLGAKAGITRRALVEDGWTELLEVPFDPGTKRMATLHGRPGANAPRPVVAAVKGAPEALIEQCSSVRRMDGERVPLDAAHRDRWRERARQMAGAGQRVLALACGTLATERAEMFAFEDLDLLGLVGMIDPPRADVPAMIEACRKAGIRVVMVTGDHPGTAVAVAAEIGLARDADGRPMPRDRIEVVDGRLVHDLLEVTDERRAQIMDAAIFARATPRQKLDLIALHRRRGEIVAMTGDGVNDAPALRKADIGVAMGRRGTQVARDASDMILQDDRFGTIVHAIEQGRAILTNVRKFVIYLLSCNLSELLVVGSAAVSDGPLPILPLQILFLNLVTDVFPALALGVCEGNPSSMREPPRPPGEAVLRRGTGDWFALFGGSLAIALGVWVALLVATSALGLTDRAATTVAFLTLAVAQMLHVFTMRASGAGVLRNEITANPWIWAALVVCAALLLLAVHWPPLAELLTLVDPGVRGWATALMCAAIPLVLGQVALLFADRDAARRRGSGPRHAGNEAGAAPTSPQSR